MQRSSTGPAVGLGHQVFDRDWVECEPLRVSEPAAALAPVVVIDNYDSFTYNLVQCIEAAGGRCLVHFNDAVSIEDVKQLAPRGILLSPGPGTPEQAGITLALIRELAGAVPMLGVCLGHQALSAAFGARVVVADRPQHGKTSAIEHDGQTIFESLPCPFAATRYHSLVVADDGMPACLQVSARTPSGEIMALRHRELPLEGVQFHPESILTQHGARLVQNWLRSL